MKWRNARYAPAHVSRGRREVGGGGGKQGSGMTIYFLIRRDLTFFGGLVRTIYMLKVIGHSKTNMFGHSSGM